MRPPTVEVEGQLVGDGHVAGGIHAGQHDAPGLTVTVVGGGGVGLLPITLKLPTRRLMVTSPSTAWMSLVRIIASPLSMGDKGVGPAVRGAPAALPAITAWLPSRTQRKYKAPQPRPAVANPSPCFPSQQPTLGADSK